MEVTGGRGGFIAVTVRTSISTDQLRAHVVRLAVPGSTKILGTGVFAAPGWVLTCAHLVEDLSRVEIADASGRVVSPQADVVARSRQRDSQSSSSLWPFPDLALLRFDDFGSHPVALLDAGIPPRPGEEQDCVAWGYARRELGVDPVGSPASFRFQGVEGDDFLSLKSGLVAPGLSGAPLVSPQRRAVVGVMTATRNPSYDLGGWASPIWPLATRVDGIPGEIPYWGQQVLEANRRAVLLNRSAWHAVLPVEGRELLESELVSWGVYEKSGRADPADLLLPEYRVVQYLFRDDELGRLEQWCLAPDAASVAVVAGVGGSGKTRSAIELCAAMRARGWVAGEVPRMDDAVLRQLAETPLPRVVVVDYAEDQAPDQLRTWMGRLASTASDVSPVRVVLLNRERAGFMASPEQTLAGLRSEATVTVRRLLDDRQEVDGATAALDHEQRRTLFREARLAFARAWEAAEPDFEPSLTDGSFAEPLGVLFEALSVVLESDEAVDSRGDFDDDLWPATPAGRVLAHEEKYWLHTAPDGEDQLLLRQCVALATLTGASCASDAEAVLAALPALASEDMDTRRHSIARWLGGLYRGEDFWNPLRPDRLGESLVINSLLRDQAALTLRRLLEITTAEQLERALEVLARCTGGDDRARRVVYDVLAVTLPLLVNRAEAIARGTVA